MSRRVVKWRKDTAPRIKRMRDEGKTWAEIAIRFRVAPPTIYKKARDLGIAEIRAMRRFTVEEDQIIRDGYLSHRDLNEVAASIGRKRGDITQRILRKMPEILNTVRSTKGTIALRKYGAELLDHGQTPEDAARNLRQKIVAAKAVARVAAMQAKANRANFVLSTMKEQIAAGKSRNRAMFEARMLGASLQAIADCFDITRERVRQICDHEAFSAAVQSGAHLNAPEPEQAS